MPMTRLSCCIGLAYNIQLVQHFTPHISGLKVSKITEFSYTIAVIKNYWRAAHLRTQNKMASLLYSYLKHAIISKLRPRSIRFYN